MADVLACVPGFATTQQPILIGTFFTELAESLGQEHAENCEIIGKYLKDEYACTNTEMLKKLYEHDILDALMQAKPPKPKWVRSIECRLGSKFQKLSHVPASAQLQNSPLPRPPQPTFCPLPFQRL